MEKNQNPTIKLSDNTIECYTLKCNQERFENITFEVYLLGDLYCIIVIDSSDPKNRKYSSYELDECETSVFTIKGDLNYIKDIKAFDRYMENETVFIEHFEEKALNSVEPIYGFLKEIIESHLLDR